MSVIIVAIAFALGMSLGALFVLETSTQRCLDGWQDALDGWREAVDHWRKSDELLGEALDGWVGELEAHERTLAHLDPEADQ